MIQDTLLNIPSLLPTSVICGYAQLVVKHISFLLHTHTHTRARARTHARTHARTDGRTDVYNKRIVKWIDITKINRKCLCFCAPFHWIQHVSAKEFLINGRNRVLKNYEWAEAKAYSGHHLYAFSWWHFMPEQCYWWRWRVFGSHSAGINQMKDTV